MRQPTEVTVEIKPLRRIINMLECYLVDAGNRDSKIKEDIQQMYQTINRWEQAHR